MNERLRLQRAAILSGEHHRFRKPVDTSGWGSEFMSKGLTPLERATERIVRMHKAEEPVILPGERLVYTRTTNSRGNISVDSADIREESCPLFTDDEWSDILKNHFIHFTGDVNNLCPRYEYLLDVGTRAKAEEIRKNRARFLTLGDNEAVAYMDSLLRVIGAIEDLAARYREAAEKNGNSEAASALLRVPFNKPAGFFEALQFLRILNFTLYLSNNHHNSLGRLDQYLYPYFKKDIDTGVLSEDEALELVEEFFLSLNKDTDLYYGMQFGDNGQAVTLGGKDAAGNETYNALSELCIKASLELMLIDPKLNLRVHSGTPQSVLEVGSQLTRQGLGFPQYANDDVVIPALIRKGYAPQDAYDYAIAACWEFIIPGKGMEIVDIEAISLPRVVNECISENIATIGSYKDLMRAMREKLAQERDRALAAVSSIFIIPAPAYSLMMYRCVEDARDVSRGNVYNNYGIVATGISTAVDSIAAIKKLVFEDRELSLGEMRDAVEENFEGFEDLHAKVRYDVPKFGNDDQYADDVAVELLDLYAGVLESAINERGGRIRPGTGSAMYYVWHPREIGASPDGRLRGEPFAANFSPSLNVRLKGPLSVLRSFAKPDMQRLMNGGPVTLELQDTSLSGPDGTRKLAHLVRFFIDTKAQQLQLNAVNAEKLREAMREPEQHKQLIVRVWGWSGYFVQLDEEYQKQIIQRTEFAL